MKTAFTSADILLPKQGTDMRKWAVVACDQFTSEPEYWETTRNIVGEAPSTLKLILPEVYLEAEDTEERLAKIQDSMKEYEEKQLFTEYKDAMIYVERMDSTGKMRAGLIGQIDLEKYDYHKGSKSQIRATEATVPERIPPRIKVRENAMLELPHIMMLIDDVGEAVIEPLEKIKDSLEKVYDFELMQNGGSIKGYLLGDAEKKQVEESLSVLNDLTMFNSRYGVEEEQVLLYAMGDGNHSLATAKEFYEQLKKKNPGMDLSNHPARYALVELVNLHSPALEFEPIYRVVMETDVQQLIGEMREVLGLAESGEGQKFSIIYQGIAKEYVITKPTSKIVVGSVQNFLDNYLKWHSGRIDYIHGAEILKYLSQQPGNIGFVVPTLEKNELYPTVIIDGALPRKTFSMGHAQDKRYYLECRKITR